MRLLRRNSLEFFIGDIPGSPAVSGHRPHLGVGPEGDGHEAVGLERRLWAVARPCLFQDTPDAGAGILDELDAVEDVGDERVAPHAPELSARR